LDCRHIRTQDSPIYGLALLSMTWVGEGSLTDSRQIKREHKECRMACLLTYLSSCVRLHVVVWRPSCFSVNTRLGVCCYHDYYDVTTLRPLFAGRMAWWRLSCPQNLSTFGPSSHKEQALTSYMASASLSPSCISYTVLNYLLVTVNENISCIFSMENVYINFRYWVILLL
jgi:hypothetical protein